MNKVIALATFATLTSGAFAQLNPLPPSSLTDGVTVQSIGVNSGVTHWEDTSDLAAYRFASNDFLPTPIPGVPDNALGLNWTVNPPSSIADHMSVMDKEGGTLRVIFTGESAGWLNDFGYTRSGNPAGAESYTVYSDIQAVNPGSNINFGDHFDISFSVGDNVSVFDLWLNGVGAMGPNNASGLFSNQGGVFTAFHPTNSTPYAAGQVKWASTPLAVNTWVPALNSGAGGYGDVATYLLGWEDVRLSSGPDGDNNDFMVALQYYRADGTPFSPVPEPSTYGAIGALALVGLIARRRFLAKKA